MPADDSGPARMEDSEQRELAAHGGDDPGSGSGAVRRFEVGIDDDPDRARRDRAGTERIAQAMHDDAGSQR